MQFSIPLSYCTNHYFFYTFFLIHFIIIVMTPAVAKLLAAEYISPLKPCRRAEITSTWSLVRLTKAKSWCLVSHVIHITQLSAEHTAHRVTISLFNFTEHGGSYWLNLTTVLRGGHLRGQKHSESGCWIVWYLVSAVDVSYKLLCETGLDIAAMILINTLFIYYFYVIQYRPGSDVKKKKKTATDLEKIIVALHSFCPIVWIL